LFLAGKIEKKKKLKLGKVRECKRKDLPSNSHAPRNEESDASNSFLTNNPRWKG